MLFYIILFSMFRNFHNLDIQKGDGILPAWNGRHYSDEEFSVIDNAVSQGFSKEEINIFACVNSHGKPIYKSHQMSALANAILSFGANSPQVEFLTLKYQDCSIWSTKWPDNSLIYLFYSLFKKGFTVNELETFLPEKDKISNLDSYTVKCLCDVEGHELEWPDIKKIVKQLNDNDGKPLPSMLPASPTSLYINYRGELASSRRMARILHHPRIHDIPARFFDYFFQKNDEGNFATPISVSCNLFEALLKLSKEQMDFVEVKNPAGEYIVDFKPARLLVASIDNFESYIKLFVTDENGNLLLTPQQIRTGLEYVEIKSIDEYVSLSMSENESMKADGISKEADIPSKEVI